MHAFLAGGDPHHFKLPWVSSGLSLSVLWGVKVSSSSKPVRSIMGFAVSKPPSDDCRGALDNRGASGPWRLPPCWSCGQQELLEGVVCSWQYISNGSDHGLTKTDGRPASRCRTTSPSETNWGANSVLHGLVEMDLSVSPETILHSFSFQCRVRVPG